MGGCDRCQPVLLFYLVNINSQREYIHRLKFRKLNLLLQVMWLTVKEILRVIIGP